ncbi:MAG: SCO1664 family protein [Chloroflexi bacterium]|nr:SCO1664 family protein [Chloroflexota bacterium]
MERFPEQSWDPLDERVAGWLSTAAVTDGARIPYASNYVFLLELQHDDAPSLGYAVYKPGKGENPLWDFPPNLYRREVAAYRFSAALGWNLIPPTVEREEGLEYGIGSLQAYIPTDYSCTFFELREQYADDMRRFALFDWMANNADRKGGHILKGVGDQLWGIDNGLSFHQDEKLRTVIWDYAGEPISAELIGDVEELIPSLDGGGTAAASLAGLLSDGEIDLLRRRAERVLDEGHLPAPPPGRRAYPWPLV